MKVKKLPEMQYVGNPGLTWFELCGCGLKHLETPKTLGRDTGLHLTL